MKTEQWSKTTMSKVTGSMVLALGCVVIGVGENSSIFAHVSGDKSRIRVPMISLI